MDEHDESPERVERRCERCGGPATVWDGCLSLTCETPDPAPLSDAQVREALLLVADLADAVYLDHPEDAERAGDRLRALVSSPEHTAPEGAEPERETVPCDRCEGKASIPWNWPVCEKPCPRRGCPAEPGKPAGRLRVWERDGVRYVLADEDDRLAKKSEWFLNMDQPYRADSNFTKRLDTILVPLPAPAAPEGDGEPAGGDLRSVYISTAARLEVATARVRELEQGIAALRDEWSQKAERTLQDADNCLTDEGGRYLGIVGTVTRECSDALTALLAPAPTEEGET